MHNYNATLVHWHQTLGCQCSSFGTYDVHKVVPVKVLFAEKLNYFMTSLRGKNKVEVKFENSMHNYNATLVHWHQTLGCQCSSFGTYDVHKVVPVKVLFAEKLNYFMTSLRGKNEVEVKFENSMHNYNATLVHWHHTLGCQCSSFYTYAVHKVVPVRVFIAKKLNYFTTSLRGKNKVEVKFENSMHNYNASLVHWHHTLGCQCSSFGTYAVHKVGPVKQSKTLLTDGQTDGRTDGQTEIINLIVGLVTRNPPKNLLNFKIKIINYFFRGHVGPLHKIQGYQGHQNVSKCSPHHNGDICTIRGNTIGCNYPEIIWKPVFHTWVMSHSKIVSNPKQKKMYILGYLGVPEGVFNDQTGHILLSSYPLTLIHVHVK